MQRISAEHIQSLQDIVVTHHLQDADTSGVNVSILCILCMNCLIGRRGFRW